MNVFKIKNPYKLVQIFVWGQLVFTLNSCSLIRIESEQEPLSVKALNTRLLTQEFVGEAMELTQKTADSIFRGNPTERTQKLLLIWQITTAKQLKALGFQASPQVSLLDVWTYMLKTKYFFENLELKSMSPETALLLQNNTVKNANQIEKIASNVLNKENFKKFSLFVENQARAAPITFTDFETMASVKEAYLKLTDTPDSLSVRTVGTLSEVVADLGNKISYGTDLTRKQLSWETQLYLKEKGLDTIDIEKKIEEFQAQTDRLITVAENSPELLDSALINFRNQINPLFIGLERGISSSLTTLSAELAEVDLMVERERIALDSMVKRERKALALEAHDLVDEGIKNTMKELRKTISTLTILAIIFMIVLLGLPFYAGYLLGKKKNKT